MLGVTGLGALSAHGRAILDGDAERPPVRCRRCCPPLDHILSG